MSDTEQTQDEVKTEATQESQAVTNVDFKDLLSEDYRAQSNIKDFKTADDLAKSYIELQRMVGNSVRIPGEDATEEARNDFYSKIKDVDGVLLKNDEKLKFKLGVPEKPEEYDLKDFLTSEEVQQIPGINSIADDYKKYFHEMGFTNEQALAASKKMYADYKAQTDQLQNQQQLAQQELKKMWGADYDNRLQATKQMGQTLRNKYGDAMDELIHGPAGNNPVFLNLLSELANSYKEKGHEGFSKTQFGLTPETALDKIQDKKADRGFMEAYTNNFHPGHDKAVAEMQRLYSIANDE